MRSMKWLAVPVVAMTLTISSPIVFAAASVQPALINESKVTEAQAKEMALARVPNGVVKSSELETEHGRLIWSFDISKPRSKNMIEIQVDAKTGMIVSVKSETPAAEAKEANAEKTEK